MRAFLFIFCTAMIGCLDSPTFSSAISDSGDPSDIPSQDMSVDDLDAARSIDVDNDVSAEVKRVAVVGASGSEETAIKSALDGSYEIEIVIGPAGGPPDGVVAIILAPGAVQSWVANTNTPILSIDFSHAPALGFANVLETSSPGMNMQFVTEVDGLDLPPGSVQVSTVNRPHDCTLTLVTGTEVAVAFDARDCTTFAVQETPRRAVISADDVEVWTPEMGTILVKTVDWLTRP